MKFEEKDYSYIPGIMWCSALILFVAIALICCR
jgi:hypothetical protein